MFKKVTAMLLSATILASTLVACSAPTEPKSSSEPASTPTTETSSGKEPAKDAAPIELSFPSGWAEKLNDNQLIAQELDKKFNVKIKRYAMPEKEALNLQITSGEIPDFFWGPTMPEYHKFIEQGVLAEVPIDTIKGKAPRLSAWAEKSAGGEQVWSYYDHEGKNYGVPELWTLANNGLVVGYREDMLNAAGVQKVPETIEETEAALTAIKGKYNIAPLTSVDGVKGLSAFYGAFDIFLTNYEKDGKIVCGYVEPEAKEAVTLLNKWYKGGLIDPEFMINKFDNVKDKWGKDQAAITEYFWWEFLPKEAFFDGRLYEINKDREGVKLAVANAPKGASGASGLTQSNPVVSGGLVFGSHLEKEPEKLAKYLEIFDYSFDREMSDLLYYGKEGETFNYNDTTGVEWIAPYDTEEKRNEYGINLYLLPGCFNDYDLQAKYMTQPQYLDLRKETEVKGTGKGGLMDPFYRPKYNEKSEVLDKIWINAHIDFITGARPITEWDAFVAEWMKAGGTDVLAEMQTLYDATK